MLGPFPQSVFSLLPASLECALLLPHRGYLFHSFMQPIVTIQTQPVYCKVKTLSALSFHLALFLLSLSIVYKLNEDGERPCLAVVNPTDVRFMACTHCPSDT